MKVLLTGGSGDLGRTLVPMLLNKGHTPVILDVRAPWDLNQHAVFIQGSILDRSQLTDFFRGCDCIVHIAAWHGIHESRDAKTSYDFFDLFDLNVRGTFEVFEAAVSIGINKIVYISTTSVHRPDTRYGSSKILAEHLPSLAFFSRVLVAMDLLRGCCVARPPCLHPRDYPLAVALRNAVRPDAAIEIAFCRIFAED